MKTVLIILGIYLLLSLLIAWLWWRYGEYLAFWLVRRLLPHQRRWLVGRLLAIIGRLVGRRDDPLAKTVSTQPQWRELLERLLEGSHSGSPYSPGDQLPETAPPASDMPVELRLDAAVPEKVQVHQPFFLAVIVKLLDTPLLAEADLPLVTSGELLVAWPADQPFVRLRFEIIAPDCKIEGKAEESFRFYPTRPPRRPFFFQLTPQRTGEITITVKVYQEDELQGDTRLQTIAEPEAVGQVGITVTSQPAGSVSPHLTGSAYNLGKVQSLLNTIFSETELRDYCLEEVTFRPVYDELRESDRKGEILRRLLEHADRKGLIPQLLAWAKATNALRYAAGEPYEL